MGDFRTHAGSIHANASLTRRSATCPMPSRLEPEARGCLARGGTRPTMVTSPSQVARIEGARIPCAGSRSPQSLRRCCCRPAPTGPGGAAPDRRAADRDRHPARRGPCDDRERPPDHLLQSGAHAAVRPESHHVLLRPRVRPHPFRAHRLGAAGRRERSQRGTPAPGAPRPTAMPRAARGVRPHRRRCRGSGSSPAWGRSGSTPGTRADRSV